MTQEKPKNKRTFKVAPVEILDKVQSELKMTGAQITDYLGYSRGAEVHWRKSGEVPEVAAVALQLMLNLNSATKTLEPSQPIFMLRPKDSEQAQTIELLLKAINVEIKKLS